MQRTKKHLLVSLQIVALGLLVSVNCSGQTVSPTTASESQRNHAAQDSETLKATEIANIRLAAANETIKLLNDRLVAKDAVIEAREAKIALRDEQLALAQSANKDRAGANTIDQFRVEACQAQLSKADAEISRLRNPPFLKRMFSSESLIGFGFGYGVKSIQK